MRLKLSMGLVLAIGLSGCMTPPQSAEEVRKAVKGGGFLTEHTKHNVSRNYSSVVASVRAGAKKCMNRNFQQRYSSSPGPGFAPVMQTVNVYYSSTMKSKGKYTELALHRRVGSGRSLFGGKTEGFAYVADIHPANGGAQVHFYGGKFGYGPINKAVLQWAKGGAIRCPDLP